MRTLHRVACCRVLGSKSDTLKSDLFFTVAYKNWSRSGQNGPEGHDFAKFVPLASGTTSISTEGRCCLILFDALKCGTSAEDVDVLNFTCRLAPGAVGFDDGEDDGGLSREGGKK